MKQPFFIFLTFLLFQCQSQEPKFEPKVINMDSLIQEDEVEWREIDSCKYFYLLQDSILGHSYKCPNSTHKFMDVKP
jgi:hypothetical protein